MLNIRLICVGKLRERFYIGAAEEYVKRIGRYCKIETVEITETHLPENPSGADIESALSKEAAAITEKIPKGAAVVTMCVEGETHSSTEFAALIEKYALTGVQKICFVVGGSYGLNERVKEQSDLKLSMSKMTFPHHLARVMLLEQIYRAFKITEGGKYNK